MHTNKNEFRLLFPLFTGPAIDTTAHTHTNAQPSAIWVEFFGAIFTTIVTYFYCFSLELDRDLGLCFILSSIADSPSCTNDIWLSPYTIYGIQYRNIINIKIMWRQFNSCLLQHAAWRTECMSHLGEEAIPVASTNNHSKSLFLSFSNGPRLQSTRRMAFWIFVSQFVASSPHCNTRNATDKLKHTIHKHNFECVCAGRSFCRMYATTTSSDEQINYE